MNALVQSQLSGAPATILATPAAEPAQYLTFMLAGDVFAIGILAIKEIIEYQGLTEVPLMPRCVRGVINLRGAVVPVVDLLARFRRPPSPITKRSCIVIVEVQADDQRQVVGVMVDAVNEVLDIAEAEIEPPPAFGTHIRSDFILGMGKVKGKFVILLNVDKTISLDAIDESGDGASMAAGAVLEEIPA